MGSPAVPTMSSHLLNATAFGNTCQLEHALNQTPRQDLEGSLGDQAVSVACRTAQKKPLEQLLAAGAEPCVTQRQIPAPARKEPTRNSFVRIRDAEKDVK